MPIDRATFGEAYELFKTEFIARAPDIDDFSAYSEQDAMAGGAAAITEFVQAYVDDQFRQLRVGGAEDQELKDLALDQWRLEKTDAAAAKGEIDLSRPSATPGAETITEGDEFESPPNDEGVTKRVKASDTFVMTGTALTISVEAVIAGTDGNTAENTFVSASGAKKVVAFIDTTITFTQPGAIAGGAEEETDPAFRDTIRDFIRNRQRATIAATILGAKQVGGVASVTNVEDPLGGLFTMYIADASGRSSQPLRDAVLTELDNWRANGVIASVDAIAYKHPNSGSAITVQFVFASGVTVSDQEGLIDRAFRLMLDYTNTRQSGETWYRNMCEGRGREADPDKIDRILITAPAAESVTALNTEIIHAELGDFLKV